MSWPFKKASGGGNWFAFAGDKWQLNLSTTNLGELGDYNLAVLPGDQTDYVLGPICVTGVVVD